MSTQNRRGSILLLTALGSLFILGICALVTDIGYAYFQQSRLQTAVDNAWRSGFDEYSRIRVEGCTATWPVTLSATDQERIRSRVRAIFQSNGYSAAEAAELVISLPGREEAASLSGRLIVSSRQTFGLFFARAMNFQRMTVGASRGDRVLATGTFDDGGSSDGWILPIGIPHGEVIPAGNETFACRLFPDNEGFQAGREYLLRLGRGAGSITAALPAAGFGEAKACSNHGSLDLARKGGGADEYRNLFINGWSGAIRIGDRLSLQPGQTDDVVEAALAARCRVGSEARRVTVPIVDTASGTSSGGPLIYEVAEAATPVRVIGFAVFDLVPTGESSRGADFGASQAGQLWGTFVRYLAHPAEARPLLSAAP